MAEDFTFGNVRLAAAGIAHFLLSRSARPRVVVGYDTRFLSEQFAAVAAEVLRSHGVETQVAARPAPTPALTGIWTGPSTLPRATIPRNITV